MPLRQLNFEGEGRAITSAMCLGEVEVMDMIRLYFIILSYIMVLCFFFCAFRKPNMGCWDGMSLVLKTLQGERYCAISICVYSYITQLGMK